MNLGKKTKIVCTIGPVIDGHDHLESLVHAGMNVMRLNFSHGSFGEHQKRVDEIRNIARKTGKTIAIMQDLSGPKIRVGDFAGGSVMLRKGAEFVLTTDRVEGTENKASINHQDLPKDVKPGTKILLDDGTKALKVKEVCGNEIITEVIVGGQLSSHKGVNVPGVHLSVSCLTAKDRADLEFGIKNKVDFVALSFVRRASDITELRDLLAKRGLAAHIIAKIETPEAVKDFDAILAVTDGVMVARGDLAIEIPSGEVPMVQKMIIRKCNIVGKPVITATQMLESMVKNPVPTRAETSDIANAIMDGTDAIMLSEETTYGLYPVQAVKTMTDIAKRVEREVFIRDTMPSYNEPRGVADVMSRTAILTAHTIKAKLIVVLTRDGEMARLISRYHPVERILVLTDSHETAAQIMLSSDCYPIVATIPKNPRDAMEIVRDVALKNGVAKKGDKVVIVTGVPVGNVEDGDIIIKETV